MSQTRDRSLRPPRQESEAPLEKQKRPPSIPSTLLFSLTLSEGRSLAGECRDRRRKDFDEEEILNQGHDEHPAERGEDEVMQETAENNTREMRPSEQSQDREENVHEEKITREKEKRFLTEVTTQFPATKEKRRLRRVRDSSPVLEEKKG